MPRMMLVLTVVFCLWALPSQAAVPDPWTFTSLGTLNASETISINTDTLALTGEASYSGVLDQVSGAGIFTFDDISGANLSIFGTRTLGLLSRGNITFTGTINLLGSGGLDMVSSGSMTLSNLRTGGGVGTVSLVANQINAVGTIDSGIRPLGIRSVEPINLSGEIGSGDISLLGRSGLIVTTGTGITGRTVNLGSGAITLTAETISGGTRSGLVTVSTTGEIIGSPGVNLVAPVPVPAAFLLFATGLGIVSLALKRWRSM
jgi:hypothetical protein